MAKGPSGWVTEKLASALVYPATCGAGAAAANAERRVEAYTVLVNILARMAPTEMVLLSYLRRVGAVYISPPTRICPHCSWETRR